METKFNRKIRVPVAIDILQSREKILDEPEIRVWCHPKSGGDDYWMVFENVKGALKFIKTHEEAEETPLFAFNGFEYDLLGTEIVELPMEAKDGN